MALACNTVPHFTTIASFVSGYSQQIEALFEQILLICHEDGLLGNELFAIDGCKLPSNAAKEWSGTFKELAEKRDKLRKIVRRCVREHKATDKRSREGKERARRAEQKIETLNRAADEKTPGHAPLDDHYPTGGKSASSLIEIGVAPVSVVGSCN